MENKLHYNDAIGLLYQKVEKTNYEDLLYEVAHELIQKYISEIEKDTQIVDDDGEDANYDDQMWYDEDTDALTDIILDNIGIVYEKKSEE